MTDSMPPCYIKARDMHFIGKYLDMPSTLHYKLCNFAKMENLTWKKYWRDIMGAADFYTDEDIETFILFLNRAMMCEDMEDRF